jgi:hypothetical protein
MAAGAAPAATTAAAGTAATGAGVPAAPGGPAGTPGAGGPGGAALQPQFSTEELLWLRLSQTYNLDEESRATPGQAFSAIEWDARARPGSKLELSWRGNFDVYGEGIGYQNVSVFWRPVPIASVRAEWRTARDSNQDFLDVSGTLGLGRIGLEGRSRYNLAESTFVENRASIKYTSQCWDVTLGYVRWTDEYQYTILMSLKGIGTVVRI